MIYPSKDFSGQGFTIVELMIATLVFSVILLISAGALLQVGRTYYKGINSAQTQDVARAIMDDISQAIQYGDTPKLLTTTSPTYSFCARSRRYNYVFDTQLTGSNNVFYWDNQGSTCGTIDTSSNGGPFTEMMGPGMRLVKLEICGPGDTPQTTGPIGLQCSPNNTTPKGSGLWSIDIRIAFGDNDLLQDTDNNGTLDSCVSGAGSQYCATAELSTIVGQRL